MIGGRNLHLDWLINWNYNDYLSLIKKLIPSATAELPYYGFQTDGGSYNSVDHEQFIHKVF